METNLESPAGGLISCNYILQYGAKISPSKAPNLPAPPKIFTVVRIKLKTQFFAVVLTSVG